MRWLAAACVFALGAVTGALGMRAWLTEPAPDAVPMAAAQRSEPTAGRPSTSRRHATVWATLENGVDLRRVPAVVLRNPAVVLLRFEDYIRANRASWTDARGTVRGLDTAVAVDLELGLLAFAHNAVENAALDLIPDDGSLYLGLPVSLLTPAASRDAFVDSAAIELGHNDYRYELGGVGALDAQLAAVTAPGTGMVIGLATRGGDGAWLAMDAGTLRTFLDDRLNPPLSPLARVSDAVFDAPLGLAREFDTLVASGRWQKALQTLSILHERAPTLVTSDRRGRAHSAMERHARALVAAQRIDQARDLLVGHMENFGANRALLDTLFPLVADTQSWQVALALFGGDPSATPLSRVDAELRREVLRERLAQHLFSASVTGGEAIDLLQRVLGIDPNYATWHQRLGLRWFELGRYADAAFHLQRAIELDPNLRAELARTLNTAQQRRQVSNLVEVPLQGNGNSLYVSVRLNGAEQPFRFLLDTGASYSAVNYATLLRLGLGDIFRNGARTVELETANGRVFSPRFELDSIDVGGAIVEDVPMVMLEDMGPLDGLLGLSFLRHFDVQIDTQSRRLLLTPR